MILSIISFSLPLLLKISSLLSKAPATAKYLENFAWFDYVRPLSKEDIFNSRAMKMIVRPLGGLAACFAAFALLVNFCAPVAYACSRIPVLKELAMAVTFSKSLTEAVENKYVQPMDLKQTDDDITAEVAYLIVDQKQVNIFYRLDSDKYESLEADPEVLNSDGVRPASCCYSSTGFGAENGELRCLSIDFVDDNVPDIQLDPQAVRHIVIHKIDAEAPQFPIFSTEAGA